MSVTDELLRNNEAYAASFDKGRLGMPPTKKLAVARAWMRAYNPIAFSGWRRARRT